MTLPIPPDAQALLIRTDFADDLAWDAFRKAVQRGLDDFNAEMLFVSDRAYEGLTPARLAALAEGEEDLAFAFLADDEAITDPEHPVIVVDLVDEPGRAFRVIPREIVSVQTNLDLASMDFEDLAAGVDDDGVYRGS